MQSEINGWFYITNDNEKIPWEKAEDLPNGANIANTEFLEQFFHAYQERCAMHWTTGAYVIGINDPPQISPYEKLPEDYSITFALGYNQNILSYSNGTTSDLYPEEYQQYIQSIPVINYNLPLFLQQEFAQERPFLKLTLQETGSYLFERGRYLNDDNFDEEKPANCYLGKYNEKNSNLSYIIEILQKKYFSLGIYYYYFFELENDFYKRNIFLCDGALSLNKPGTYDEKDIFRRYINNDPEIEDPDEYGYIQDGDIISAHLFIDLRKYIDKLFIFGYVAPLIYPDLSTEELMEKYHPTIPLIPNTELEVFDRNRATKFYLNATTLGAEKPYPIDISLKKLLNSANYNDISFDLVMTPTPLRGPFLKSRDLYPFSKELTDQIKDRYGFGYASGDCWDGWECAYSSVIDFSDFNKLKYIPANDDQIFITPFNQGACPYIDYTSPIRAKFKYHNQEYYENTN